MNGSRLTSPVTLFSLALTACTLLAAGDKKKAAEPYSIVAGTVFRDPGFALPDANVVLMMKGDPKAKKLQQAVSSFRGEFAFRVPSAPATYVVKASLKGFHSDEKEAAISGGERVDVTLVLTPESK